MTQNRKSTEPTGLQLAGLYQKAIKLAGILILVSLGMLFWSHFSSASWIDKVFRWTQALGLVVLWYSQLTLVSSAMRVAEEVQEKRSRG